MERYAPVEVKVSGSLACFTRPEMKVERVSYPVMTPSAARGVLEAIFWKPQFRWLVREIAVLREIRYFSLLRNEIKTRASPDAARRILSGGVGYYAEEDRAQRHTLALRDVSYIIRADIDVKPGVAEDPAKFRDQFRRRYPATVVLRTYLAGREFSRWFTTMPATDTDRARDWPTLFDLSY